MEPPDLPQYEKAGGYRALRKTLQMAPKDVMALVKESNLRGRGGALLDAIGPASDPRRRDLEAALTGCAAAIRHRNRILA